MIGWHGEADLVAGEFLKVQPAQHRARGSHEQRDLQHALPQPGNHFVSSEVMQFHPHLRALGLEGTQRRGKNSHRGRRRVADMKFAAQAGRDGARGLHRVLGAREHRARLG